ncbi:MipA/OmpV family protein [Pseudoteredinibacter isoporae]|uniref:Outer membrane protein n=1 Tax=Pseudoteredinibacter isoporae TaxID=570281 RepID=A0A7X0MZ14_9GAMM|nr:MipA/OmpV family protein [Pseudoteredinibacter isoporae]MBB6522662.1 outer membrane protein [Pseudoteredinibacter isoporae]NHO88193.1 MipA/OmpV family protein [Pseudoteredinibacter isoporae]NIB23476.1 MipA/OmpV family protein [Pseudoteredinibacter isoporae]
MRFYQFLTAACLSAIALGASAQDNDHDDEGGEFALGIIAANDKSIYVGGKDEVQPFPFIQARWGNFYFEGPSLGYVLYEDNAWTLTSSLSLDGIGDSDRDNSRLLADMPKFDSVVMGEIGISHEAVWGELSFSMAADISNSHDGYTAELEYGYPIEIGSWMIEPSIGVKWSSDKVNQYFYGVEQQYVRADRPFYRPDAGIDYGAGITAMYPFMKQHAIIVHAEYESFSKEISDSPIVDRDNTVTFGIGYVYRF